MPPISFTNVYLYQLYWVGTLFLQVSSQILLILASWQMTNADAAGDRCYLVYVFSNAPFVVLTFASAYLCRVLGYRSTHLFGQIILVVSVVVLFLYTSHSTVLLALAAITLWHAGIAIRGPSYHATISLLFDGAAKDTAFAWHTIAVNLSKIFGPMIAAWIALHAVGASWLLFMGVSIAISIFAILFLDKTNERAAHKVSDFVVDRGFLVSLTVVFLISTALVCNRSLLPSLIRQPGKSHCIRHGRLH